MSFNFNENPSSFKLAKFCQTFFFRLFPNISQHSCLRTVGSCSMMNIVVQMRTLVLRRSYTKDHRTRRCRSTVWHCCHALPPATQRRPFAGTRTTESFRWEIHGSRCWTPALCRLQVTISCTICMFHWLSEQFTDCCFPFHLSENLQMSGNWQLSVKNLVREIFYC